MERREKRANMERQEKRVLLESLDELGPLVVQDQRVVEVTVVAGGT